MPWRLIGQRVEARSTAGTVQIVADGQVVATHVRAERGRRTNPGHYPPEKIAFHLRTPTWCRTTAATIGPACTRVIEEFMVDNALFRLRAAQGILGLRTRYGNERLENACTAALSAGDPSYRTIKGILAAGVDTAHLQAAAADRHTAQAAAVPAFLRGQDSLFAAGDTTLNTVPDRGSPAAANVFRLPTASNTGTTTGTTTVPVGATGQDAASGTTSRTEAAR